METTISSVSGYLDRSRQGRKLPDESYPCSILPGFDRLHPVDHFQLSEFSCPCCGQAKMKQDFLERLDYLRNICGFPFVITSGYRCSAHNLEIGGAKASKHMNGIAADIACSASQCYTILAHAHDCGFRGIGVSQKGHSRFIHLDTRENPVVWSY